MTDASRDTPSGADKDRPPIVVRASLPVRPLNVHADTNQNQLIDRDLYCVRCEYNLRTLSADALCPECAHPVAVTLRDEIDPLRKRLLRRHVGLYLLATALHLLPSLMYAGGYVLYRVSSLEAIFEIIHWPAVILGWAATLLGSYAVLHVSRRRMLARGGPQYPTLRWTLRLGVIYSLFMRFGGYRLLAELYGSGWFVVGQIVYSLLYGCFGVLLIYYLWRLLAPSPLTISRRLRLWGALIVINSLALSIFWILDFWGNLPVTSFTNAPFPALGDVIQLGMHATFWAVIFTGILALVAIRRHLQGELQALHDTEVDHESLANQTA